MEQKILDSEFLDEKSTIRPIAILVEFLPPIALVIYSFIVAKEPWLIALILPLMSIIYLIFGWYLFKSDKFKYSEIIYAELVSLYLVFCSIAIIWSLERWSIGENLLLAALILGIIVDYFLIRRFVKYRQSKLEFRYSLKLLSRVLLFQSVLIFLMIISYFG